MERNSKLELKKLFNLIQDDVARIEKQLENPQGSGELWRELNVQYSMMLPEVIKHVSVGAKVFGLTGIEFNYNSELSQLKSALLTWLVMNEGELEFNLENIANEAKAMLDDPLPNSLEEQLKYLLLESKIYIAKSDFGEKRIGLEKIWDAFERLKTIESTNKKHSVEKIISEISGDDKELKKMLDDEFTLLTTIGNSYSIRHHEITQQKIPSSAYVEYLYFRMLALISFVLNVQDS